MNLFEQIFQPLIDFINALFRLAQGFLDALQNFVNALFDLITRLFGG